MAAIAVAARNPQDTEVGVNTQFWQIGGSRHSEQFENPFNDVASLAMPNNWRSLLKWAEYVYSIFGTYRMAMERINAYFLTDVQILDSSEDVQYKWLKFYNDVLGVIDVTQHMNRNKDCYGSAFATVLAPFQRWLVCPKCSSGWPLKEVFENQKMFGYKYSIPHFYGTCPACKTGSGYSGKFLLDDRMENEEKDLKVKIWDPHQIEILWDQFSEDTAFLWRIPEDYKSQIRRGEHLYALERVPYQIMRAISLNQMFRFYPGVMFHMKEPTLAGLPNRGWGLPRILSHFRQIWFVQVLRRSIEALALDFVIPFRVITPAPNRSTGGSGAMTMGQIEDPYMIYDGGQLRQQLKGLVRRRRKDPAGVHVLPFPVQYQTFGAEASQVIPVEMLDHAQTTLLNDAGAPVELYTGSLQVQATPVALRLFESTWRHRVLEANRFLAWLTGQCSSILRWEKVNAVLKRVTLADNLERQMLSAQLAMSEMLSGSTLLEDLGYNWKKEQRQLAEEARTKMELQAKVQEQSQQAGFSQQMARGMMAGGGAPMGDPAAAQGPQGGGAQGPMQNGMPPGPVTQYLSGMDPNTPQRPEDLLATADMIASDLAVMPESLKNTELRRLAQSGQEALHGLVLDRMKRKRSQVRQDAGNAALAQMQQQGQQGM